MPKEKSQESSEQNMVPPISKAIQGTLYVVSTPIGNPEDLTMRALRILREVAIVAAEDPSATASLLHHYGVCATLTTYDQRTKDDKIPILLQRLREGQSVALVSDCGTPGILDPGCQLIARTHEAGLHVVPVPGPSAFIAALAASGLSGDACLFDDPLPHTQDSLRRRLTCLRTEVRTLVFSQAITSLYITLTTIRDILGERMICVALDLTREGELLVRGTARQLLGRLDRKLSGKDVTLVVEGYGPHARLKRSVQGKPVPTPSRRFRMNTR